MAQLKDEWRAALNIDLKNSPIPSLPLPGATLSEDKISGQYFLQLEESQNVLTSSLKQFQDSSRRMFRLKLTDGKHSIVAVEMDKINGLSVSTPPGTKLLISGTDITVSCAIWLLEPHHVKVLGGNVPHMVRAWEIHRDVVIHGKRGDRGERPAWIPFGQPLKFDRALLNFRAMEIVDRNAHQEDDDDEEEENEKAKEFALHRQQVLAEAKASGSTDTKSDTHVIGPADRRPPRFLQITANFMTAEEKPVVTRPAHAPLPRDARDLIDTSDPGVEPTFRGRGRGRGRGGRGGRRGGRRGNRGEDDYGEGSRPQRTTNLMDFVTQQLNNL